MIYTAPSYLKELVTEVDNNILNEVQKEYGTYSTAFKFNKKFKSLMRNWNKEFNEYGTTIWGINENNEKITIFDPAKNGYDGVMGLNEAQDINTIKTINFENDVEIIVAFQYSGDEEEYLEDENSIFEEDIFGWIAIYKYENGNLEEITNIECA